MKRRTFLRRTATSLAVAALPWTRPSATRAQVLATPRILLRSSWQVVNIGDIAHTPGLLALLERHIPTAEVVLWASADLTPPVAGMLNRRFPKLRIVKGTIGADGRASDPALADAVAWSGFLLHGSGPSMVGRADVAAFVRHTRKPFGVYGITYGGFGTAEKELLGQARFAYFRDSVSLEKAKADGIRAPVMDFAPDAAFAADLRDDGAGNAFLAKHGLEAGRFLCCIPRLRYTPYWTIQGRPMNADAERRHARNEEMKEHDHAPLREAIVAVTRRRPRPLKVLLCPEDRSQMAVAKEMLLDKLPPDARANVVWREDFWLTDEALSTYVRSAGLFGLEMHSPIMCVGNGVPAIVCRFAEQTSKGFMWKDIGLGEWLFDFDGEEDPKRLTPAVLSLLDDPAGTKAKVTEARNYVRRRQRETMAAVFASLYA